MHQLATRCSRVIDDLAEVDRRLDQIGIDRGYLAEVAHRADSEGRLAPRQGLSGNRNYRAVDRAIDTLASLGPEFGYVRDSLGGIPCVLSPTHGVAITATIGDTATGRLDELDPSTMTVKGPRTRSLAQGRLDFDGRDEGFTFLVLLIHATKDELRIELSEPMPADHGRITAWAERIIIGDVSPLIAPVARFDDAQEQEVDSAFDIGWEREA